MMGQVIARRSSRNRAAVIVLGAAALAGCNRAGGEAEQADATAATFGVCIGGTGACVPDPGSAPADCSQDDTVDSLLVESFDNYPGTNGPAAEAWYTYTDGTSGLYFEDAYHKLETNTESGYQPAVAQAPAAISSCHHPSNINIPYVLHVFAGPFLGWGGGMGISMAKMNGRLLPYGEQGNGPLGNDPNAPKDGCCTNVNTLNSAQQNGQDGGACIMTSDPRYAAICPPADTEYAVATAAVDVSQYDGVSFWARRGPNSQAGIRVMVGDKYTDDDLNYQALSYEAATGISQPTYCHRNRECGCTNHQACTPTTIGQLNTDLAIQNADSGFSVSVPGNASDPVSVCGTTPPKGWNPVNLCKPLLECVGANGGPSFCCDTSNCNSVYPAFPCDVLPDAGRFPEAGAGLPGDPQFYGKPCTPYAWPNGVSSSYCFDPKTDPPPWPPTELCGDFWMTTIDLTTDWQFIKVPFSTLRQQGWAKRQDHLDLHSASVIRFSWDLGYIDYWLDQVSFYKEKTGGT
jgi:hypothetical protein